MATQYKIGFRDKESGATSATLTFWQKELVECLRKPEATLGVVAAKRETFDDFENFFLYDSVGWGVFAHDLHDFMLPFARATLDKNSKDIVRLAVLQSPVTFDREDQPANNLNPLKLSRSVGALFPKRGYFEAQKQIFVEQIREAIENGADVIMTGEFSCPHCRTSKDVETLKSAIKEEVDRADRPVFVIAGSHHRPALQVDGKPFNENIAMVFSRDPDFGEFGPDDERPPYEYSKRSPAISMGERVYSPADMRMPVYVTPFGNIGVLICSDAFDTRVLYAYLRENRDRKNRAQFILIPTYNESQEFYRSCRYLSYLANATVVVFNSHNNLTFPDHATKFFVAGLERGEIGSFVAAGEEAVDDVVENRSPQEWSSEDKSRARQAIGVKSTIRVNSGNYSREVAFWELDRVTLEAFCKGMRRHDGPLARRTRPNQPAKK